MISRSDFVRRIQAAAAAAIADQSADLDRDPETIKGLTVELTIGPNGVLRDVVTYLERRKPSSVALLDHHAVRAS